MRGAIKNSTENTEPEESGEKENQRFRLTLPFSSLPALLFLGITAMALAYIGGVMSGRHSAPENRQIEAQAPQVAPELEVEEPGGQKILTAKELDFARALRGLPPINPEPAKPAEEEAAPPLPENKAPASPSAPVEKEQGAAPVVAEDSGEIFDYVFQMGAFRDETGADNLRQSLEGRGFRTMLERNGKMYIVCVRLRGDARRAAEVSAAAQELRLGEPILRQRQKTTP